MGSREAGKKVRTLRPQGTAKNAEGWELGDETALVWRTLADNSVGTPFGNRFRERAGTERAHSTTSASGFHASAIPTGSEAAGRKEGRRKERRKLESSPGRCGKNQRSDGAGRRRLPKTLERPRW